MHLHIKISFSLSLAMPNLEIPIDPWPCKESDPSSYLSMATDLSAAEVPVLLDAGPVEVGRAPGEDEHMKSTQMHIDPKGGQRIFQTSHVPASLHISRTFS